MKLQALLVLSDESAAEVLGHVLEGFHVESEHCADPEAVAHKLSDTRFDQVVLEFDDPAAASHLLQCVRQSSASKNAVTVGLLSDPSQARTAFGMGASFVLYKPVSPDQARATLRAATALLKHERRRTFRVPVQLPVVLSWFGVPEVEGILLDLSEDGMDVLSAQPLQRNQSIELEFSLTGSGSIKAKGRVAWANANGQTGVQFIELDDEQRSVLSAWLSANSPDRPDDAEPLSQCKLSDLSLGGCYVETESPFPRRARIDLCLRASGLEVHAEGLVRVMHPNHGMGIEFSCQTEQQREQIEDFINFLTSQPDTMPQLVIAPKSINFHSEPSAPSPADDPQDSLLQLLRQEDKLSQEEFLSELRRQRRSQAEATTA